MILLANIVSIICRVLIYALLARSILSWIVYAGNQRNHTLMNIYNFIGLITEPLVTPVRKLMSRMMNTGPMDFAPLATMILLVIIRNILVFVLIRI